MGDTTLSRIQTPHGAVSVATRDEISASPTWRAAFADHRQDHRYYHIVEDTIRQGFEHGYLCSAEILMATIRRGSSGYE